MKAIILIILSLALVILGITATVANYNFESACGNYLKLAGDAPSIEKADEFLKIGLDYIESEKLTSGNTGVIFRNYPTNDLSIWYEQIKGAKETTEGILKRMLEDSLSVSQLERDNALMKIREVLLDNGQTVTAPDWIHLAPYSNLYIILFWTLTIFVVITNKIQL